MFFIVKVGDLINYRLSNDSFFKSSALKPKMAKIKIVKSKMLWRFIYVLTVIGAAVYYISQSTGFWSGVSDS
jgi:hypothetical protein